MGKGESNSSDTLDPKSLLEHHFRHFDSTRSLQWKNNTAVWTVLVAVAYIGVSADRDVSWGICLLPLILPLHVWWNWMVQDSLNFNKDRWIALPGFAASEGASSIDNRLKWPILQGLVTAFLLVVAGTSLWFSGPEGKAKQDGIQAEMVIERLDHIEKLLVERADESNF